MHILGAGITGLLLGYLTSSPVYGVVAGGQLSGIRKGPRILELDENTENLVKELGITEEPRAFRVGYKRSRTFVSSATYGDTLNYYRKTRGSDAEMPDSVMSGGKSSITGWDMNEIDLVKRLLDRVNYVPARITDIDFLTNSVGLYNQSLRRPGMLPLDECISTINIKSTLRLIRHPPVEIFYLFPDSHGNILKSVRGIDTLSLDAYDTTFVQVPISSDMVDPIPREVDYVYCLDPDDPINRITWTDKDIVCFEFRGDRFDEAVEIIEGMGYSIAFIDTIRFCQLKESHNILEIGLDREGYLGQRLKLCGRFARWTHNFKLNNVFQEAALYVEQMGD